MKRAHMVVAIFVIMAGASSCKVSGTVGDTGTRKESCNDAGENQCEQGEMCDDDGCDDTGADDEDVGDHEQSARRDLSDHLLHQRPEHVVG